jgi:hypothetical protein
MQELMQPQPATVQNPNAIADAAIENRDVQGLTQIAKDTIGTPASEVAMRLAQTIEKGTAEFNKLVAPIEKAGGVGTPEGNIQVANVFQTTADNPKFGTALLKYVLGDKMGAVKQITGGDITKKISYDNNGNQIEETHNALGEALSYFDPKLKRNLSKKEYAERVGGISSWENTLKGKTDALTRAKSSELFVKEEEQANNWYQLLQGQKPLLQENYNVLQKFKTDLDPKLYNQIVGSVSQSMGQASSKSNSKSALNQLTDALARGESVKVDDRIASALRLNPKLIGTSLEVKGDQLVSKDNNFKIDASKLKSLQETDTVGSESSKNAAQTMASLSEAERLGKINPVAAQQLRRVIENSQRMGVELSNATDKYGKPSFISLPTSASFIDKQAQTLAQSLTGLQNADQMENYIKYRRNAVDGHTRTNTVPLPGQIGTNYTLQPLSKEIRKFYADEIGKVMNQEFTARSIPFNPSIDVKFPQPEAAPAAQPARSTAPVAPPQAQPKPKARPSLADLKKQAGG